MILSPRFEAALQYAAVLHNGQHRKASRIPYIAHLLGVASLALEFGADEDEAIAALLHDAVEDAGGASRLADIRVRFGERVAEIVLGCTDTAEDPKPPWQQRKSAYLATLAGAAPSVQLVCCCDKLHNARGIVRDLRQQGDRAWEKFTGGKEGTLWYYASLLDEFRRRHLPPALLDEFDRTVAEMQQLAASIRS
jgi:(p)ppGpp synthase/HD superfamily hydrolase